MGTRSLIYFQEKRNDGIIVIYIVIYQQYDGYLAVVGRTLATFLKAVKMVNGFAMAPEVNYSEGDIICNGFGDVVAQFIQQHKQVKEVPYDFLPATFDIYPAVYDQYVLQDYDYYVTYDRVNNTFTVKVDSYDEEEQYEAEMSVEQFAQLCDVKYVEHMLSFLRSILGRENMED